MEGEQILGQLNEPQKEAVTSGRQPVLVVAGAGSGKTRVLVHKIAWLIGVESISPHSILAVTFTNKAANEMNNRIRDMLNIDTRGMWVGTFHGLAHKFLRLHWQEAGLQQNFQILDSDDQHRQIKRLVKNMSLDEAYYPPKEIQWYINTQKDQGFRSSQSQTDPSRKDFTEIYKAYEEVCEQSGLVDFGELLLRCFEVLASKKELLEHYQSRFRHILVDEFQDTNEIQYQWIKLLSGNDTATFVVGDDDQSIYKWRGANSANMARFQKDYQGSRLIKLEQNYRSTKTILDAANAIIKNNDDRMEKKLWTDAEEGPLIKLHGNYDEYEESRNIIETILARSKKIALDDIAILYRSNAQSRVIEEALLQHSIPYRVYGGFRFFDRAEVKDVLAYLRVVVNNNDNIAFERAANMPPKGIGAKTMGEIR
ncbi:MAG: UvrD-helicase domain-containing protein, partial [Gammaproteobacteria bacterium]|nr:UvrD-helicase domain-containing protein [Gammaproteobacteria bacterium]